MAEKLIIIAGPTASGKSELALAVAGEFGGELVNADSMQVYRDLRVMTARPGRDDEARVRHHLYGTMPGRERCSAALWCAQALTAVTEVWERGRVPILVGGTGLYLRAFLDGMAPVPEVPADIRAEAEDLMAGLEAAEMHGELARIDAGAAARLAVNDRQRILRAWQVMRATGRSIVDWRGDKAVGGIASLDRNIRIAKFVLEPPRDGLYARCDARLGRMLENGGREELEALEHLGLDPSLPIMKALGVQQLLPWLRGEAGFGDAMAAARTETRRYAKRQTTWFRNQFSDWTTLKEQQMEKKINVIFPNIRENLLTE